jgi:hypothetical protein
MAGKIFINYRRSEDAGFAQALFGRLEQAFPREQLFMDVDNIEPGLDFVQVLHDQVAQCDVLIAIIGNHWVDVCDESGARRLDNPEDFVRIEIEAALKQDKRVIPVLVGLTQMPRSEQLPDTLKTLTRRHAVRLTHERFRTDAQGLIAGLQRALKSAESARGAQAQEEERKRQEAAAVRQQAEAEHLRREAETKRRAEEEERERKAEEQERQKEAAAVLSRQRADEERRARDAEVEQRAAEQRAFTAAKRADTVGAIDEFLRVYPTSQFAAEASALRATLLAREKAYEAVMRSNNPVELRAFLKRFRSGTVVEEVRGRLSRIEPELPQQTSRRAVVVGTVAAIGAAGIASAVVMIRRAPVPEETKPAPEETKPAPLPKPSVPASRLLHVLSGSTQPVEIVVFNRDGSRICTENSGGKEDTRLWDVSSGSLSFYSSAGPPQLWDAQSGSLVAMLSGHTESLNGARFSPDGSLIVTASNDQTAPIWDGRTGGFMIDLRHSAAVWSATFDTEGKVILTTSTDGQARDGVARVWTKAGMLLTTISVPAAEPYGRIGAIFNPGGDLVLTTFDKFAQLWKASTDGSVQSSGKPIATIGLSRRAPVPLFNSDGSRIVTVVEDTARLWEGRTGAPVATNVRPHWRRES